MAGETKGEMRPQSRTAGQTAKRAESRRQKRGRKRTEWGRIWAWLRTHPKGRDWNTGPWTYDTGDGYSWDGKTLYLLWPGEASDTIYAILDRAALRRRGVL